MSTLFLKTQACSIFEFHAGSERVSFAIPTSMFWRFTQSNHAWMAINNNGKIHAFVNKPVFVTDRWVDSEVSMNGGEYIDELEMRNLWLFADEMVFNIRDIVRKIANDSLIG